MSLQELMQATIDHHASDLHLCTGYPPTLRVHGKLTPLGDSPLTEEQTLALIEELIPSTSPHSLADDAATPLCFNTEGPGGSRFRAVVHKHCGGSAATLRLWPASVPTPDQLGLPGPLVDRIGSATKGLVLITGPTGSGKSTTMYSLVDYINATRCEHIIWLSDPAEYVLQPKQSMIRAIEVGPHLASYARAALRMDPDIIVLAEMRDLASIQMALTMAETGHLVFSTLHCPDTVEALQRMVEVFPSEQQSFVARQLAWALYCVIAQRLFPRADRPGRVGAYEVLGGTHSVREAIAGREFTQLRNEMSHWSEPGQQTLHESLKRLVKEGQVREEDAKAEW